MKGIRPSISLAVIVKNEAENLPQLIESVKDCVDEICITDTGSTDGTVELAKKLGATVNHFDWVNDFSKARNFSFAQVKTDYTFWMDGDDILEDPKEFKTWRDEIMHLGDYWLANYVYSSHPDGRPACTFVRERVIKNGRGATWRYFVHEGIVPPQGSKVQFTPAWRVKHMRTAADLEKDRSRNLDLYEKNPGQVDARMLFYWGKEFFEAGKPLDAIRKLEDSLVSRDLEMHDRILGTQYLAICYQQLGQFEKSVSMALTGLQLSPQRAEFMVAIGDSYIKMNRWPDAIPYFEAATKCTLTQGNAAVSPVFNAEDAYGLYPKNQLIRLYANMGQVDHAVALAEKCLEDHKSPETAQILSELTRISGTLNTKTAKQVQDIVFTSAPNGSPYVWDGDEYRAKGMGGSETACIEMAEHFAKISGRPIKVFNQRPDRKTVAGVEYVPVALLNEYLSLNRPYIHIAWRHSTKLTEAPTFVWCHDLITPGVEQTGNHVKAICLTPFHADFMHSMQLVPYDKIWVTRNGIKPDRFTGPKVKKNPNKIVFPSSPDRGMDRAILICDELRKDFPDLELHCFYGIEHLPQWGHQALHDKLLSMFKTRPWVKYHGKTEQSVLAGHLKEAVMWLHPCDFIETSCITAMEMIASGVYPVTRRLGGLKNTLAQAETDGMATLLNHDCVTPEEFAAYTQAAREALLERRWERTGFQTFDPNSLSWEKVAKDWLAELPRMAGLLEPAILPKRLTHVSGPRDAHADRPADLAMA